MQRLLGRLNYHFQHFVLYSTSSTTTTTVSDSFANYLVDSLGFPHQQALSASTRLSKHNKLYDSKFVVNATSVLTFFRHYGFDNTHLTNIVSSEPRLLCSNVDNTIQPKFKFLLNHGFSQSDLIRVVSVNPTLLLWSLESSISPAFHVLSQIMGCDTLVITLMKKLYRNIFGSICSNLRPNVDLLTSYGIPIELIKKHFVRKPKPFLQSPGKFKEVVIRVENTIGISPNSPVFLYDIILLSGLSEANIESKCRVFKSFGWTQSDVNLLMMKRVNCFTLSVESIEKKLDFLMNELQLKPAFLITNCSIFTHSMEKKMMPRRKVLQILKGEGLLEKYPSFYHIVCLSEARFLKRFVVPFKEVHQVYAKHTGCSMKMLTQEISVMLSYQQALSTSSRLSTGDSFANYLVDSLGFSHEQAFSTSAKFSLHRKVNDFNFDVNATSVVTFLKTQGFSDTHIRKIVCFYPRLLNSNVKNTIQPKFKFLLDKGFSRSDLIEVIYVNPSLLSTSLESSISPALEILRQIMGCDAHVIAILKKLSCGQFSSVCENLMPNVDLLTSYEIQIELIRKHLVRKPMAFMQNPEKFKDMVIRVVEKLGIPLDSPMFLYVIALVFGNSEETIDSKCRMFKSFGWTQFDVDSLMMKNACCFKFSEASIKNKLNFLMNELRLEPAYLISHCTFFTCSLEKRILPRHKVMLILKRKGLLEKYPSFYHAVCMSEPCFLKKFVIPFKEVHQVYAKHSGCSTKMLTHKISIMFSSDSFTKYLVHSLGFSHQQALFTSTRLYDYRKANNSKIDANAKSVVTFFKNYGFSATHLTKIVSFDPLLLCSNVKNTIEPKLKFLQDQGFSRPDLIQFIVANPKMLSIGLATSISPSFEILRQIMGCDAYIVAVLKGFSRHDLSCIIQNLRPNVALLSSYGISIELIRKYVASRPRPFLKNPENFKRVVSRVEKNLGMSRDPRVFLHGVYKLCDYSEDTSYSEC